MTPPLDDLLADARSRYRQLQPAEAQRAMQRGAVLIDTRSHEQRVAGGLVPGAIRIHRNVLEWRVDPASGYQDPRIAAATGEVIVMCQQGYSSTLAAETLLRLGVERATDLAGGFEAWAAAGLPVEPYRPGGLLGACELIAFVRRRMRSGRAGSTRRRSRCRWLSRRRSRPCSTPAGRAAGDNRARGRRGAVHGARLARAGRRRRRGGARRAAGSSSRASTGWSRTRWACGRRRAASRVAWFRDPDGNVLAVSQHAETQ